LTITAFLVGAVISMNPYLIRQSKGLKTVMLSLFSGWGWVFCRALARAVLCLNFSSYLLLED